MRRLAALLMSIAFASPGFAETVTPSVPLTIPEGAAPLDREKAFFSLTIDELGAVLKKAGANASRLTRDTGDYFEITAPDGYKYEVTLGDCPQEGEKRCTSLNFNSYAFNESSKVTLKGINDWNTKSWGARGMLFKDGSSGVSMNMGLDGVTEAWVGTMINSYQYWLTSFGNFVAGTTPAPAAPVPAPNTPAPAPATP